MRVLLCYIISDYIKVSKIKLSTTFSMFALPFVGTKRIKTNVKRVMEA